MQSLKIAILLGYHFSVRDFLFTPVWQEMAKRTNIVFYLLGGDPNLKSVVEGRECKNIKFIDNNSIHDEIGLSPVALPFRLKSALVKRWRKYFACLDDEYMFDSLMYRFVVVNRLSHYNIRRKKSREEQKRLQIFTNYKKGERAGALFPESRFLYKLLYELRHSSLLIPTDEDIEQIRALNLDLFVFSRVHLKNTAYWAQVMRRLGIPMVGIVASWDHPTVQGPTPRGMSAYVVASRRMAQEMSELHGIKSERIFQIGKVQMDVFKDPSRLKPKDVFFRELGIPVENCLITFGTNTTGLKEHEISIAKKLAADFVSGKYGKATLLIRTHPQDVNWKRDFQSSEHKPTVICLDGASFGARGWNDLYQEVEDITFLANLMNHSSVVIQSRGSLALDAISFDTPVISLAFDGDLDRIDADSFVWEYCYEHYKPLVAAEGMWMVGSYGALERAIKGYIADPSMHADGRERIRLQHLEPLDGCASARLINLLIECAEKARKRTLPLGDWAYPGFGDLGWAGRQWIDIDKYIDKGL
jgi:hypothetical protein